MKDLLKSFLLLTVPTFLLLWVVLELFFRWGIPASQYPLPWFDDETLVYRHQPNQEGVYTAGKAAQLQAKWRINAEGWNSLREYLPQDEAENRAARIAVLGDSYIEALQVDVGLDVSSLLDEGLGEAVEVYAFGKSGAPFSQYLNYARYVEQRFDPDLYIINLVHNDFSESVAELSPRDSQFLLLNLDGDLVTETEVQANPKSLANSWWKRLIYRSAVYRYVVDNLKFSWSRFWSQPSKAPAAANIDVEKVEAQQALIRQATDYLLGSFQEELQKPFVLVLDAPRGAFYKGQTLLETKVFFLHQMMAELCQERGVSCLDLGPLMEEDYREQGRRFESQEDNHWNEYGHQFVAERLLELLKRDFSAILGL